MSENNSDNGKNTAEERECERKRSRKSRDDAPYGVFSVGRSSSLPSCSESMHVMEGASGCASRGTKKKAGNIDKAKDVTLNARLNSAVGCREKGESESKSRSLCCPSSHMKTRENPRAKERIETKTANEKEMRRIVCGGEGSASNTPGPIQRSHDVHVRAGGQRGVSVSREHQKRARGARVNGGKEKDIDTKDNAVVGALGVKMGVPIVLDCVDPHA
ncbi:hypothetical protein C8R45DRAFT_929526 [Mycena sanguinolenta]|nr:hypothetical protein C8R45DRAFT_929526 [Mycena sanguinolenta]